MIIKRLNIMNDFFSSLYTEQIKILDLKAFSKYRSDLNTQIQIWIHNPDLPGGGNHPDNQGGMDGLFLQLN